MTNDEAPITSTHSSPPQLLNYCNPSFDRRVKGRRRLGWLAVLLAISAGAVATWGWNNVLGQNIVLNSFVCLAGGVAVLLLMRVAQVWQHILYRLSWIMAVVMFGLWGSVFMANQFHGRPPPIQRYLIACCVLACAISAVGLAFDSRPPKGGE